MEYVIAALLLVLVILVITVLLRQRGVGDDAGVKAAVNESFVNFQSNIQQTLDSTRKEVASSKDVLSANALKTMETVKDMEKALQAVMKYQQQAEDLGKQLASMLQAPKLRGNYGEEILEEMLRRILPVGIWERQYAIEGSEKVDAVVKYRDVVVPIDAKFPRDDYDRYREEKDAAAKARAWKGYVEAVKKQVRDIARKYIKPEAGTSEFALMFIPSEAIYYETVAAENELGHPNELYEFAQSQRVLMVSPNTFYAFLQVILMGIRNIELIRSARVLQENLAALEKDFSKFFSRFEEIGKGADRAAEAFRVGRGHVERFKRRLEATLKLELPDAEDKAEIEDT